MRVKLFSLAATTPIQSLENDINEFLEIGAAACHLRQRKLERHRRVASVGTKNRIIGASNRRWRN